MEQALPAALAVNNSRADTPHIVIANSGGLRFDLYEGPFTKTDALSDQPWHNGFFYIPNVTLDDALQVLPVLNGDTSSASRRRSEGDSEMQWRRIHEESVRESMQERARKREQEKWARGDITLRYNRWLQDMDKRAGALRRDTGNLTLGYVTTDVSLALVCSSGARF